MTAEKGFSSSDIYRHVLALLARVLTPERDSDSDSANRHFTRLQMAPLVPHPPVSLFY